MKYVWKILYIIFGLLLIFNTHRNVQVGDVCQTIYGCFAIWLWYYVRFESKNS